MVNSFLVVPVASFLSRIILPLLCALFSIKMFWHLRLFSQSSWGALQLCNFFSLTDLFSFFEMLLLCLQFSRPASYYVKLPLSSISDTMQTASSRKLNMWAVFTAKDFREQIMYSVFAGKHEGTLSNGRQTQILTHLQCVFDASQLSLADCCALQSAYGLICRRWILQHQKKVHEEPSSKHVLVQTVCILPINI